MKILYIFLVLFFNSAGLYAQEPKKPVDLHTFDTGWLARAHWASTAFDLTTTWKIDADCHALYGKESRSCGEQNPLAWPIIGHHQNPAWRLALGFALESAAVSKIHNKKLRRTVQVSAIAGHLIFGIRNLRPLR